MRSYLIANTISLISYNTIVAELSDDVMSINGYYTPTTGRHINEFLLQNGFSKITKKQMEEAPFIAKLK